MDLGEASSTTSQQAYDNLIDFTDVLVVLLERLRAG